MKHSMNDASGSKLAARLGTIPNQTRVAGSPIRKCGNIFP